MINIEPIFADILETVASKEGVSRSSYIRSLLIQNFYEQDLIDKDSLLKVLK